jgi:DMSO/TMAO reductase YedYZ molybdopterin-dependent catalytic subunit
VQEELRIREKLPVHSPRDDKGIRPSVLRVDGLVGHCLELTLADLERLPQQDLTDDFTCLEGWTVPNIRWRGVLLETVVSLTEPRLEARYVQASAGDFSVSLPRDRAERALLAIRLYEGAVPSEHGGPVRLVVPGGECFMSIKWLDHLELRGEPGANTAETIALGRLAGGPASRFTAG